MVRMISNSALDAEESRARDASRPLPRVINALAAHIDACWQSALDHHDSEIKPRLLDCLRRRQGIYDADKLKRIQEFGSAEIFLKQTGLKCRAAKAWIRDILLPGDTDDRPWGLDPTPLPDLPQSIKQQVYSKVMAHVSMLYSMTGAMPTPMEVYDFAKIVRSEVEREMQREASERALAMEVKIADQFIEGGFRASFVEFIDDLVTFPLAILKGPTVENVKTLKYIGGGDTPGTPSIAVEPKPRYHRVSPFDFYPSPRAGAVDDGYICEALAFNRRDLYALKGVESYRDDEIDAVLGEAAAGGAAQFTVRTDNTERLTLESKDTNQASQGDDKIEGIEFWGTVPGSMLIEWGMPASSVKDPAAEYDVSAIKIGNHVIRALINPDPLGRRPYYVTSYEKVPGSLVGQSIPETMTDLQDGINAVWRAIFDNVAFASGPQEMVDMQRVPTWNQVKRAVPRKIWFVEGSQLGAGKPVDFFQPDCHVREYADIAGQLVAMTDDHTGIPAYSYGSDEVAGAGKTASGLSMLFNAASKGIRQVIANTGEDVLSRIVERQYVWNLLYLEDDAIKGDCNVNARGVLGAIIREQRQARRQEFLMATNNPVDMAIIGEEGRRKLLRETSRDLEIPGLVPDETTLLLARLKSAVNAMSQAAPAPETTATAQPVLQQQAAPQQQ